MKEINKTTTSINLPSGFRLKGYIKNKLDELRASGTLMLKLTARKAIIDHCVSCPEIYGRAMQPKSTKKGFIVNGMIDTAVETYPDIIKMIQTCKLKVTQQ